MVVSPLGLCKSISGRNPADGERGRCFVLLLLLLLLLTHRGAQTLPTTMIHRHETSRARLSSLKARPPRDFDREAATSIIALTATLRAAADDDETKYTTMTAEIRRRDQRCSRAEIPGGRRNWLRNSIWERAAGCCSR